jgi:hypothetical protein
MAALGAQAYMSSLQAQSSQAVQQAQNVAAQKANELLSYSTPSSGLTVTGSGPTTTKVIAMILKYPNGTVYTFSESTLLPAGTSLQVVLIVPSGNCGTAICLSKYNSIVSGIVTGSAMGLVTSLGNVFWYNPGQSSSNSAFPVISLGNSCTFSTNAMAGFGVQITPRSTGDILVVVHGDAYGPTGFGPTTQLQLNYGTGTPPSAGAAQAGTAATSAERVRSGYTPAYGTISGAYIPFSLSVIVKGLTAGTQYWFDIYQVVNQSGQTIENVDIYLAELPS